MPPAKHNFVLRGQRQRCVGAVRVGQKQKKSRPTTDYLTARLATSDAGSNHDCLAQSIYRFALLLQSSGTPNYGGDGVDGRPPGSVSQVGSGATEAEFPSSERRIRFREVSGDQAAGIDIVFVPADKLESGTAGSFREPLGRTGLYIRDVTKGELGRAVIPFSADITGRPFRLVALYEIGHSTGLWGHSRNLGDIMFSTKPPNGLIPLIELTERDRNTICANYYQPE